MKYGKRIAGILFVILFAYLYAHVAKTNSIYDRQIDSSQYIGTGVPAVSVEQTFLCEEETLDAIQVKCQIYGETEGTKIEMALYDCESGEEVAGAELAASDIKNGKFNTFAFETVSDCKNKEYKVVLSNVRNEEQEGAGIGVVYQAETENGTSLTVNGEERAGTLIMKTVTDRFDLETFVVLLCIIFYVIIFFVFLEKLFAR